MATTDNEIIVHRKHAELAYELKKKYLPNYKISYEAYMRDYDTGEIHLSTVYENLFVTVSNCLGIPVEKISEHHRDFSNNGDMKIGVIQKNGHQRRYVIRNTANKKGTIYFVGWNWVSNSFNFYSIPKPVYGVVNNIAIVMCPKTGNPTTGKYRDCMVDSFEDMCLSHLTQK